MDGASERASEKEGEGGREGERASEREHLGKAAAQQLNLSPVRRPAAPLWPPTPPPQNGRRPRAAARSAYAMLHGPQELTQLHAVARVFQESPVERVHPPAHDRRPRRTSRLGSVRAPRAHTHAKALRSNPALEAPTGVEVGAAAARAGRPPPRPRRLGSGSAHHGIARLLAAAKVADIDEPRLGALSFIGDDEVAAPVRLPSGSGLSEDMKLKGEDEDELELGS
jgi:hypothetical protein